MDGPIKYNTFGNLDREVFYWGLKAKQLLLIGGGTAFVFVLVVLIMGVNTLSIVIIGLLVFILGIPIVFLIGKLKKANRRGHPDYQVALRVKRATPKKLLDTEGVIKKIDSGCTKLN